MALEQSSTVQDEFREDVECEITPLSLLE